MIKTNKEYLAMVDKLNLLAEKYYNEDDPEVSDYEYDMMMNSLKEYEASHPNKISPNSPTQKVGGSATMQQDEKTGTGTAVTHKVQMGSLRDVFDTDSVKKFVEDIDSTEGKQQYVVEKKIDGLSISLEYKNGKFVRGSTRGNGFIGEDVTENLKQISCIPQSLKEKIPFLEVRGEVFMSHESFMKVNEKQDENNEKLFKNPRNCAAGTLRQKNATNIAERNLQIFIFNIQQIEGKTFSLHSEGLTWLASQGFPVSPDFIVCNSTKEVLSAIDDIGKQRNSLAYPIDGAVVKVDNLEERTQLGHTAKVPRWAVAYKYPPEQKTTVIRNIQVQVGRTGRLTPVAIFDPVSLAGTSVSKATLHNQDQINRLGVGIGDTIIIQKAADIIPEILSVVKDKRPTGVKTFVMPTTCPVCGHKVEKDEIAADIRCLNPSCPAQISRSIEFFGSKDCMDIKGFGSETVEKLISSGYIKSLADIYTLKTKREELITKNIIGKEKTVDNLLKSIENSKTKPISNLIKALGARNVGGHAGKILSEKYADIYEIAKASKEDLMTLPDFGETTAEAVVQLFNNPDTMAIIKVLEKEGVNISSSKSELSSTKLKDLTFVITGTLPHLKRDEASKLITDNGGKVTGSVSKKTNYLLAGEDAGSKLTKAQELGINIISEEELLKLLSI